MSGLVVDDYQLIKFSSFMAFRHGATSTAKHETVVDLKVFFKTLILRCLELY